MASIGAIFSSTPISLKAAVKIHGHTRQLVMWQLMASCLLVQGEIEPHKTTQALMDIWQTSEMGHSKTSLGNFQYQYLPKLLHF